MISAVSSYGSVGLNRFLVLGKFACTVRSFLLLLRSLNGYFSLFVLAAGEDEERASERASEYLSPSSSSTFASGAELNV